MKIPAFTAALVVTSLLFSSSAIAQQRHIVDSVTMNRAVAAEQATDQQNRDVVLSVLHQPQTREIANRLGLDVTKADAAIATLSGPELARMATQARSAKADLAGGSTVVIVSTTTLLLIIIIVILIAK